MRQHALGAAFADRLHVAAFLQQFAADVQRQVGRVDHALDEAQVHRQQRLGLVHDEDALDVQLDAGGLLAVPQVERRVRRDVQQLDVLGGAFHPVVRPGQRRLVVVADLLVELLVLLGRDVLLGPGPQRAGLVDGFPLVGEHHLAALVRPSPSFHSSLRIRMGSEMWSEYLPMMDLSFQVDRYSRGVLAQVQRDAGAALRAA